MKRLFLLPALLLLLLSSCKDDDVEPEIPFKDDNLPLREQLQGNWTNYLKVEQYYDLDGEVMHTDSAEVRVIHEFTGNTMNMSFADGKAIGSLNYSLPDTSTTNKDYIVFLKDGKVLDYYQIKSIDDTEMVWEMEVAWAGYVDESGDTITSAKGVYIYDFKRE